MKDQEMIDSFLTSWRSCQGDTFSDRMARQSLEVMAMDVPAFGEALKSIS